MTIYIVIMVIGIVLDRFTKIYATNNFIDNPIKSKFFKFVYLENRGAAFGILQNKRIIFVILTVLVVFAILYYFFKNYKTNKPMLNFALSLVVSGALGNFYDRIFQGYVVDFIDFSFIDFPIFNVADILITTGSILLIIYIMFFEK